MGVSCVRAVEPRYDELPKRLQGHGRDAPPPPQAPEKAEIPAKAQREAEKAELADFGKLLSNGHQQSSFEARLEAWVLTESRAWSDVLARGGSACVRGGKAGLGCSGSKMNNTWKDRVPPEPLAPMAPHDDLPDPPSPAPVTECGRIHEAVRPFCLALCCRTSEEDQTDDRVTINLVDQVTEPALVPLAGRSTAGTGARSGVAPPFSPAARGVPTGGYGPRPGAPSPIEEH